jgi:hypothetical protein
VEVQWLSLFQSITLGKQCTSYNAPPTSWKHAADHWLLQNFLPQSSLFMVRKAQKSNGVRSGLYGGCSDGVPPINFFQAESRIQFRSRSMWFMDFSNHEKGALRQEISKWSMVCSTFSRSGRSVVRSASLAKGGTLKKRPLLHLHKVPIRSNKVSTWTFPVVLVLDCCLLSIMVWSVWLFVTPSGEVQVCGSVVLLKVRFFEVAKFTALMSLSYWLHVDFYYQLLV